MESKVLSVFLFLAYMVAGIIDARSREHMDCLGTVTVEFKNTLKSRVEKASGGKQKTC